MRELAIDSELISMRMRCIPGERKSLKQTLVHTTILSTFTPCAARRRHYSRAFSCMILNKLLVLVWIEVAVTYRGSIPTAYVFLGTFALGRNA